MMLMSVVMIYRKSSLLRLVGGFDDEMGDGKTIPIGGGLSVGVFPRCLFVVIGDRRHLSDHPDLFDRFVTHGASSVAEIYRKSRHHRKKERRPLQAAPQRSFRVFVAVFMQHATDMPLHKTLLLQQRHDTASLHRALAMCSSS